MSLKKIGKILAKSIAVLAGIALICFIFWRIRIGNKIECQLQAIAAAHLPINAKELDSWYAAVPDEKNAAKGIEAAFTLMQDYDDSRSKQILHFNFNLPSHTQPVTGDQLALLSGYVEMNRDAMAKVRAALKRPACRYSIDLTWGYDTLMPHLPKIKKLTMLALDEGLVAISAGESSNVVASIQTELGLARTLDEEPMLMSQLVRLACINLATTTAERALMTMELNKSELEELDSAFAAVDLTGTLVRALAGDRATYIPVFHTAFAGVGRLADDMTSTKTPDSPPKEERQSYFLRLTGYFVRDLSFYLQAMETNIAFAKLPPPESLKVKEFEDKNCEIARHKFYLISGMLLPALPSVPGKEARALAYVRLTRAALAIELYRQTTGKLPEGLKQLVPQFLSTVPIDPFDGAPLRYRKRERGYMVYSVGPDGQDDNGRERPEKSSNWDSEKYDLTFVVDR